MKKYNWGRIFLDNDGNIEHRVLSIKGPNESISTYCRSFWDVNQAWISNSFPIIRRRVKYHGKVSWYDTGEYFILGSILTRAKSEPYVASRLISEIEQVAKAKGYRIVFTNTTIPRRIMEMAGWMYVAKHPGLLFKNDCYLRFCR